MMIACGVFRFGKLFCTPVKSLPPEFIARGDKPRRSFVNTFTKETPTPTKFNAENGVRSEVRIYFVSAQSLFRVSCWL
jgi:hypothetical protein